jgi:hydroxyacylglutathione hydrolase
LLQIADEDTFVARLVGGVGPLPEHFRWLPEVNRRGVGPPPRLPLPSLSPARVRDLMEAGARVIDVRPVRAFAAGHVAGSLSIALRPAFGSWLGWLVPPDRPLVFVTDLTTDVAELVDQCANVGFDHLAGMLAGSIEAWSSSGLPTDSLPVVEAERVDGAVLDVRTADEYTAGHLPDARHVDVGELASRVDEVAVPVDVMCGHGERAATAASLLAAAGLTPVRIVVGGPADWSRAFGVPLETGG